jgi:hypothetical protein
VQRRASGGSMAPASQAGAATRSALPSQGSDATLAGTGSPTAQRRSGGAVPADTCNTSRRAHLMPESIRLAPSPMPCSSNCSLPPTEDGQERRIARMPGRRPAPRGVGRTGHRCGIRTRSLPGACQDVGCEGNSRHLAPDPPTGWHQAEHLGLHIIRRRGLIVLVMRATRFFDGKSGCELDRLLSFSTRPGAADKPRKWDTAGETPYKPVGGSKCPTFIKSLFFQVGRSPARPTSARL